VLYEGTRIEPNIAARDRLIDYVSGRDAVLEQAQRSALR
jgi:hypothetical protein